MTKHYPLHPGQTHAEPLYAQIPLEEYERLMQENKRLKIRTEELERKDTEHTVQIAKMNGYINHLEEERRWRKFSEEKPEEEDEYYLVFDKYGYRDTDHWRKDKLGVWGFSVHGETVRYFMPLPSAPKEDDK